MVHFKNQAVGVVPIDSDGCITLVGQYRYTLDVYSWEIPEGGSPAGEHPLATAQRELLEETGLSAASWTLLQTAHLSNSVSDEIAYCYLAEDLTPGPPDPEGCERIETMHVPFAEALRMVEAGEITDALSVMGILRYALLRSGQSWGQVR